MRPIRRRGPIPFPALDTLESRHTPTVGGLGHRTVEQWIAGLLHPLAQAADEFVADGAMPWIVRQVVLLPGVIGQVE